MAEPVKVIRHTQDGVMAAMQAGGAVLMEYWGSRRVGWVTVAGQLEPCLLLSGPVQGEYCLIRPDFRESHWIGRVPESLVYHAEKRLAAEDLEPVRKAYAVVAGKLGWPELDWSEVVE